MSTLRNHLQESHKDLTQWFLLHQECLLLGDALSADKAFMVFSDYLNQHILFENTVVLVAMQPVEECLRWKLHLYKQEHDKIEKLLAKLESRLISYYLLQGRRKRLALLEILDDEQSFKHVMEHHEQREEDDLFLHFDGVLSDDATAKWLDTNKKLTEQYSELKQSLKVLLEE